MSSSRTLMVERSPSWSSSTAAGLAEMADWLMANSGAAEASQIQVAIEVPHGPVVETLIKRSFKVHAINRSKWIASALATPWRASRTTVATRK